MGAVVRGQLQGKVGATGPVALKCLRAGRQRLAREREGVSNWLESVLGEYIADRWTTRRRIHILAFVHPSASNLE
jgi:hypothetical protein